MGKGVNNQQLRRKYINTGQKNIPLFEGMGVEAVFLIWSQETWGILTSYWWWHTPTTKADLSHPLSWALKHHLHILLKKAGAPFSSACKTNVSRRPIASGSHKVKLEPSNDLQHGVYWDKFTWLGQISQHNCVYVKLHTLSATHPWDL